MFKLVVISGKLRGKEYILGEGENILGRDSGCDILVSIPGVSKQHASLTVASDSVYLKDLGSSNGTFLNGKVTKNATLKAGDRISLPDFIAQVVYVKENRKIVKKAIGKKVEDEDLEKILKEGPGAPDNLVGKVIYFFKYRIMNVVHGINEEYEWRFLFGILLVLFAVVTITLTIFPVLEESKKILLVEIEQRAIHYADEIVRLNHRALERKELDKVDTRFLEDEEGVDSYELFDLEGRIVRPLARINEFIADEFSVDARDWADKTREVRSSRPYGKFLKGGVIGIAKKIMTYDNNLGKIRAIGVIAIRFRPRSLILESKKSRKAYVESLATSIMISIVFFGAIFYLTLRPIEEMEIQIEDAIRGKRKELKSSYQMSELNSLRGSVNSLLLRIRELNSEDSGEFDELESDEVYVETLTNFMLGAGVPAIVMDSQKNIRKINSEAEDITGMRESSSEGMPLVDVSREKGFSATILEICDDSANSGGSCQQGEYDLGGVNFDIYANSLIGKDGFAKAFYITFVREE